MRRDTKDAERLEALTEQYISEGMDAEPARQRAFNAKYERLVDRQ
jgi:hypothetical protein